MTKEVKLDGPSSLPPPVTPKTVTKKYTIQGPGAQEAAVKLKAQLAAARPGKAGGPGKSLVDPVAVKAAQVQQAQQTRNASGVVNAQEVSAQQTAKGSLGTEVSAKITLPPGQFAKPDLKLLQSAAQKLGTAQARLANTFNDPGQTLAELMEANTGQHFTDAELAVLLLDVDHTERKLDEELSTASSTLDQAQAQLKVEQTKIDNSFDKMGHVVDALDNMQSGLKDLLDGNKALKGAVNDIREGAAETRANNAERAVDLNTKAQLDLTGSAAKPEVVQALLSAVPSVPPTPAQLQAAVVAADQNVTAQEQKKPQDPLELKKAKADQANAKRQKDFAGHASTRPMTADARRQMRAIVAIEEKELEQHDNKVDRHDKQGGEAKQDDKDLASQRATERAMLAGHLGVLLDATYNDATAPKSESRDLKSQLDTQLKRIDKDYGSMPAAKLQDQITADRTSKAPKDASGKALLAPGQSPIATTDKLQAAMKKLKAERSDLVLRRDQAVGEYRAMAEQSAYMRLRLLDPQVPESGAQAAAVAHAVDVTTKLTSHTARTIDDKQLALADLEMQRVSGPWTTEKETQATALKSEINALAATRDQEKTFADRQATFLYGDDDKKGHNPGAIEKMTGFLVDKRIDGTEFTRVADANTAAFRKLDQDLQSGVDPAPAIRDVDLAVGGVGDLNEHTQLDNELEERGDKLSVEDQKIIRASYGACLAAYHGAEAEADASQHDVNAQKTKLAMLSAKTPAPSKTELDAQNKVVGDAEERWQIAKDNLLTMSQAHDFVTRSGDAAPKADQMKEYLDAVGVPDKPGGESPRSSVLGLRVRLLALQKFKEPPKEIAASRADLTRTLHMEQGNVQQKNDDNTRASENWGPPAPVTAAWLGTSAKLDTFAGLQKTLVAQDHDSGIVPAQFAIAPPDGDRTQFYNAQLAALYAEIHDEEKPQDDDKKPLTAAAASGKALEPDGKTGFKEPLKLATSNFVKAARITSLHQQIDPQLEKARFNSDSGWMPADRNTFQEGKDRLQAATDKWYGNKQPTPKPGEPPATSFADKKGALPSLDDLAATDPNKAAAAQAFFSATDDVARAQVDGVKNALNPVNAKRADSVQKAITDRENARDAYAQAGKALNNENLPEADKEKFRAIQASSQNDIDKANQVIVGADMRTESAAPHFAKTPDNLTKKIFGFGSVLGSLVNTSNFYRFAERNRKAVTADANELWQKAENVVGSARGALLHATDRDAGARESVFQVLQQLVEDAAKGRG